MAGPGAPKTGGRKKNTPNKQTVELAEKAEQLGIDAFELLLMFAAGRWEELGYPKRTITKFTPEGDSYEVDVISPELRVKAATEAAQYLHPKRKAIELSGKDGEPLSFTALVAKASCV